MDRTATVTQPVGHHAPALPGALVDPPRMFVLSAGLILLGIGLAVPASVSIRHAVEIMAVNYCWVQDVPCLAAAVLLLSLLVWLPAPEGAADGFAALARRPRLVAAAAIGFAVAVAASGAFEVLDCYDFSRDEIMADFDAVIFRSGHFLAPVAPEWRPFSTALAPLFMLPVPPDAGWVSSYLPGNAAFRAVVGLFVDPFWSGPILVGLSGAAVFGIARRLWPAAPGASVVATILLCSSAQVLVTAMTSYAMSIHLAVNLLWLWMHLRDDRRGHAGAMALGVFGCGLHQLVFHPLFVAPFILALWRRGRLLLFLCYVLTYAAAGIFWVLYWRLVVSAVGATAATGEAVGATWFVERVRDAIGGFEVRGLGLMLLNLDRFVAWQPVLVLPLVLAAWRSVWRGDGIARPLLGGIALTTTAVTILLPFQGHGWGYRYLHGLIGSLCLLAGYGWTYLTEAADRRGRNVTSASFIVSTALTVCVFLPYLISYAEAYTRANRQAEAAILHAPADIVLVDGNGLWLPDDLVRNDPFLRNTPKILSLQQVDVAQVADLCRRFRVAVFDWRLGKALGIWGDRANYAEPRMRLNRRPTPQEATLARLHCGTPLLPHRSPAVRS